MGGWSGHRMIDPTEIEARFAIEDGMAYMNSIFTEPSEDDLNKIGIVRGIMESLPKREADFIDLYYFRRLKQSDIAYIFNVSQPTVCYRLQRATARIQFLLQLPEVGEEVLLRDMAAFLDDPKDVQIMHLMWETTCQSEVAKRLGVSQGFVRHRFLRTVKRMRTFLETGPQEVSLADLRKAHKTARGVKKKELGRQVKTAQDSLGASLKWVPRNLRGDSAARGIYDTYVRLFEFIAANLNILREVQRPAWAARVIRQID